MGLTQYKAKRKFAKTPEPKGKVKKSKKGELRFVVQKHDASHLHYDFRLELEGVLKSWAIPKGPSLNPDDKRLSMMVEDHPIEYASFEGIIPSGNYGAGTVMVWDEGTYYAVYKEEGETDEHALKKGLYQGNLKIILKGKKLKGEFALVKIKGRGENSWLLIKKHDKYSSDIDITSKNKSVKSKRTLEDIRTNKGEFNTHWETPEEEKKRIEIPSEADKGSITHPIYPMLSTLVSKPFDSKDWLFEIKWDGFRTIAEINHGKVNIYSRNQKSFNNRFSVIREALSGLAVEAILDGEICAVDKNGRPDFQLMQNIQRESNVAMIYYVFDLIEINGYDLTDVPLWKRKELLKSILPENSPTIKYSDHIEESGIKFFDLAVEKNLEGIIAKRKSSKYLFGKRGKDWLKIKVIQQQEAIIIGFTKPRGSRKYFGTLLLGVYDKNNLVYIGTSGGGFDDSTMKDIFSKLKSLEVTNPPLTGIPNIKGVTWVKPMLVCEIKFQEWTREGIMRQPVFMGLRDDKTAKEVVKEISKSERKIKDEKAKRSTKTKIENENAAGEIEAENKASRRTYHKRGREKEEKQTVNRGPVSLRMGRFSKVELEKQKLLQDKDFSDKAKNQSSINLSGREVKLTNLRKIYWPDEGYTKLDLIEYYHSIHSFIIPYLKDRPESLRRNPDGIRGSFFQKDMPTTIPEWIQTVKVYSESNEKDINYLLCQEEASLIYLNNLGCIELNPWFSRIQSIEYPDYIVIDLDPQDVPFDEVIEVALVVKEVLDIASISGYCKTSGSRGIHIYVPLGAKYNYKQALTFAEVLAWMVHERIPRITSLERSPSRRKNKIYIDYLQNRKGQTLASPYCVRPVKGAQVSTPLEWNELKAGLHPSQFNMKNIIKRLRIKGDIFRGIFNEGVDIAQAIELWK